MEFFKPTLRRKDMDAVLQTMVDEKIGPGERRKDFLRQAASRLGLKGGVSERSYPQALVKALKAVGVKEGDQVIASVLSPEIYKSVVESLGASLLLCDVSAEDGCLSLESVSRAFEKGGSAILLHEPIGQIPTSLDGVRDLRLPIVEDISQRRRRKSPSSSTSTLLAGLGTSSSPPSRRTASSPREAERCAFRATRS